MRQHRYLKILNMFLTILVHQLIVPVLRSCVQRLSPLHAKKQQAASTDEDVDLDMVALEAESDAVITRKLQYINIPQFLSDLEA